VIPESDESNNAATRTVTIKGNKVTNGSFEQSGTGTSPDGWTGGPGTQYDNSGAWSTDGLSALGLKGGALGATVESSPIPVAAGQAYDLALMSAGGAPAVAATYLDAAGQVVSKIAVPTVVSKISETGVSKIAASGVSKISTTGVSKITGQLTAPAGATQVRLSLAAPSTLPLGSAVWADDIWLW
jgi:hypothetical protein